MSGGQESPVSHQETRVKRLDFHPVFRCVPTLRTEQTNTCGKIVYYIILFIISRLYGRWVLQKKKKIASVPCASLVVI